MGSTPLVADRKRRRWWLYILGGMVLIAVLGLLGRMFEEHRRDSENGDRLLALQADPAASYEPGGGKLSAQNVYRSHETELFGYPDTTNVVIRTYVFEATRPAVESTLEEVTTDVKALGWEPAEVICSHDSERLVRAQLVSSKRIESDWTAVLKITIDEKSVRLRLSAPAAHEPDFGEQRVGPTTCEPTRP